VAVGRHQAYVAADLNEVSEVIASQEAVDLDCPNGTGQHQVMKIRERLSVARIPSEKTAQAMLEALTILQRFESADGVLK
jgi:hypothetical protein